MLGMDKVNTFSKAMDDMPLSVKFLEQWVKTSTEQSLKGVQVEIGIHVIPV